MGYNVYSLKASFLPTRFLPNETKFASRNSKLYDTFGGLISYVILIFFTFSATC